MQRPAVGVTVAPGRRRRAPVSICPSSCDRRRACGHLLTIAAGVALADGIEASTGSAPTLKWPNDIYVSEPQARRHPGRSCVEADRDIVVFLAFGIN